MSFLFMKNSVKRLFKIIGQADGTCITSGRKGPELSVLMDGDICLIDTESKDYNGRICLMYSPKAKKDLYQRLFIEGQTVLVCDPTDGEENETIPSDELRVTGVVIGIVRSLDAEEKVDLKDWREFEEEFPYDPLENYYKPKYNYAFAAKKYYRGNGYSCFMSGYDYGFAEGRRAEKAAPRRKRRAAGTPQGEGAILTPPPALKTAQEAAQRAGETVPAFVSRAVDIQSKWDKIMQGLKTTQEEGE